MFETTVGQWIEVVGSKLIVKQKKFPGLEMKFSLPKPRNESAETDSPLGLSTKPAHERWFDNYEGPGTFRLPDGQKFVLFGLEDQSLLFMFKTQEGKIAVSDALLSPQSRMSYLLLSNITQGRKGASLTPFRWKADMIGKMNEGFPFRKRVYDFLQKRNRRPPFSKFILDQRLSSALSGLWGQFRWDKRSWTTPVYLVGAEKYKYSITALPDEEYQNNSIEILWEDGKVRREDFVGGNKFTTYFSPLQLTEAIEVPDEPLEEKEEEISDIVTDELIETPEVAQLRDDLFNLTISARTRLDKFTVVVKN